MPRFGGFEEIKAWQKAYDVTLLVYRITDDGRFAKDFGLRDQIRRAAVSVMANIARGSAHEVQSHLHVAVGLGYLEKEEFEAIYGTISEVSRMTLSLAKYLREKQ